MAYCSWLLLLWVTFLYLVTGIGAQNETLRYITKDPSNVQQQPMIPIFRNLILIVDLVLLVVTILYLTHSLYLTHIGAQNETLRYKRSFKSSAVTMIPSSGT